MMLRSTNSSSAPQKKRWRRWLKWAAGATLAGLLIVAYLCRDHIRTLQSLRRVPGTNAYVMDYFCDYNLDEIRRNGMNPNQMEDSFIDAFFPQLVSAFAKRVKRAFIPGDTNTFDTEADHCSTVMLRSADGDVFFGRNFDWPHDACLVLRIHDADGLSSIAVIDLHYLNLDRPDLDECSLLTRLPLFFAPYYVMDGINRHGVAISEMSVSPVEPPHDEHKPDIMAPTMMRLILDYAENTQEAMDLIRNYNMCFPHDRVHLMVADASGDSRIVEFLDGRIRETRPDTSWQVCTNTLIWGADEKAKDSNCDRYHIASKQAEELRTVVTKADATRITRSIAVDNYTMWTTVYNLSAGKFSLLYKSRPETEFTDEISIQNAGR
ncbi:MAG: carcinine hydrolase/isopenicillin-N N-acyltransferase family protein [Planctomycetaceae bacterium]